MVVYYISKSKRSLWLVDLASRILLNGQPKFQGVFVAKMFRELSPSALQFSWEYKFEIFFYYIKITSFASSSS